MTNFKDAWGFSKLDVYRSCPQKFEYQFIQKLPSGSSPAMERGSKMHENIESYLNGWTSELLADNEKFQNAIDALKAEDYKAEQALGFDRDWKLLPDWFNKQTWLRVKMDAYYIKAGVGYAIDFKSGKYRIPSADQVGLYAIGLGAKHPELEKVVAEMWYLDTGDIYKKEYTKEQLLKLRTKFEVAVAPMYVQELWTPTPSNECRWCPYSKTKGGKCMF